MSVTTTDSPTEPLIRVTLPRGSTLPQTSSEIQARVESLRRTFEALDAIGDEAERGETLDYLMKALNADRLSDRPRFP